MALLVLDDYIERINELYKGDMVFALTVPNGIQILQPGVYDSGFNLSNHLNAIRDGDGEPLWFIKDYPIIDAQRQIYEDTGSLKSAMVDNRNDYGVADDVDQILAYFKSEVDDPDTTYIIGATVVKRNPGGRGGWRWHKWGPYIGTRKPTMEYLDDEPEIDSVMVFHLYQITERFPQATTV